MNMRIHIASSWAQPAIMPPQAAPAQADNQTANAVTTAAHAAP